MTTFQLSSDDDARTCREPGCEQVATLVTYPGQKFHCAEITHGPQVDRYYADGRPAVVDTREVTDA